MHYILDVTCAQGLDDSSKIALFIRTLVDTLPGVHLVYGYPKIEKFTNGSDFGPGITAVAVISESHIVVHTSPEIHKLHLDIFSCKSFDKAKVYNLVDMEFTIVDVLCTAVLDR